MKAGEVLAGAKLTMASGSQLECRGRMGFKFPSGEGQGCVTSKARLRMPIKIICEPPTPLQLKNLLYLEYEKSH